MSDAVLVSDAAGIRTVTLNRPKRLNAIDLGLLHSLEDAVMTAQEDSSVRVLVLTGAGRAFCAGDDVAEQTAIVEAGEAALRDQLRSLQRISEALVLGSKVSIASARGWAIGAGFSWLLNCDIRIWAEDLVAFFPEVGFGTFVTGGATDLLPRLVPWGVATESLYLGTKVDASRAAGLGLATSVSSLADLDESTRILAARLADLPSAALAAMKQALGAGRANTFRAALAREIESCVATTLDPKTLARMRASIT